MCKACRPRASPWRVHAAAPRRPPWSCCSGPASSVVESSAASSSRNLGMDDDSTTSKGTTDRAFLGVQNFFYSARLFSTTDGLKISRVATKHCVKHCLTDTASNFEAFKCVLAHGNNTALAFQFTASANYLNEVFIWIMCLSVAGQIKHGLGRVFPGTSKAIQ